MLRVYPRIDRLITRREVGDLTDVVIGAAVSYFLVDTDTGSDWHINNHVPLDPPDPGVFTDFRDLEADQVISWVMSKVTDQEIQQGQQQLYELRNRLINNEIQAKETPWLPGPDGHFNDDSLHWLLVKDGNIIGTHMIWNSEEINTRLEFVGNDYRFPANQWDCFHQCLVPWNQPRDLGNGTQLWPCYLQGERPIEDNFQVAVADYEFHDGYVIGTWRAADCDLWIVQRSIGAEINTNRNVGDQQGFTIDLGTRTIRVPTGPSMDIWMQRQQGKAQPLILDTDMRVQSVTPEEFALIQERYRQRCQQLDDWHLDMHNRLAQTQTVAEIRSMDLRAPVDLPETD